MGSSRDPVDGCLHLKIKGMRIMVVPGRDTRNTRMGLQSIASHYTHQLAHLFPPDGISESPVNILVYFYEVG